DSDVLTGAGTTISAAEGVAFSGTVATFTNAFTGNTAGDFTATIDWGDGTSSTAGSVSGSGASFSGSGAHTSGEEGLFPGTGTFADDGSGTASATANSTANVADAGLSIISVTHPAAAEGIDTGTVTVASFTDAAGSSSDIADLSAVITWADGTT